MQADGFQGQGFGVRLIAVLAVVAEQSAFRQGGQQGLTLQGLPGIDLGHQQDRIARVGVAGQTDALAGGLPESLKVQFGPGAHPQEHHPLGAHLRRSVQDQFIALSAGEGFDAQSLLHQRLDGRGRIQFLVRADRYD